MNIDIFNDPNDVPQPKDEIVITHLAAEPYPDGNRVHVDMHVTPFRERPNLLLTLVKDDGTIVSELNVIETMHAKMEFTIHIRGVSEPFGNYQLNAELFYETRNPPQDKKSIDVNVPEASV